MYEILKFIGAFISIHYLCFAGTDGCLILAYLFPGNGTARAEIIKPDSEQKLKMSRMVPSSAALLN